MAVPVPSISCCIFNNNDFFYQEPNELAFNWDTCCHLVICLRLIASHFSPFYCYAGCSYAEFRCAECQCHVGECLYSECYFCLFPLLFFTECHYNVILNVVMLSVVLLKDFMPNSL